MNITRTAAPVKVDSKVIDAYDTLGKAITAASLTAVPSNYASLHKREQGIYDNRVLVVLAPGINAIITTLGDHILKDRVVPAHKLKGFERALQAIMQMKRFPNKAYTWFQRNEKGLKLIWSTVNDPLRDDTDETLNFELEGFNVFNTIQAQDKELKEIHHVIKKAVEMIKASGLPQMSRLLYGDLSIVGKINKPEILAWYYLKADNVELRVRLPNKADAIHSLIHELGHRWWHKFLDASAKKAWEQYHDKLSRTPSNYPLPDVGEPLGFRVKGFKEEPIITKIENDRFYVDDRSYLSARDIHRIQQKKNFPTAYAATNKEEHFCEAFALYCLGTLEDHHREEFERVVLGR